ncbi:hypothetical protein BD626DRAFT_611999 [Schizophyllum amplum]|uniref:Uncharacterized protein n=1 Tax=Schizophyllum amplum TaxID=97359 RepID=A0A550C0L9_9AGAR|nr:hypothetical protein BD626DRAFT_611999 [Auriculariopsis ampla]
MDSLIQVVSLAWSLGLTTAVRRQSQEIAQLVAEAELRNLFLERLIAVAEEEDHQLKIALAEELWLSTILLTILLSVVFLNMVSLIYLWRRSKRGTRRPAAESSAGTPPPPPPPPSPSPPSTDDVLTDKSYSPVRKPCDIGDTNDADDGHSDGTGRFSPSESGDLPNNDDDEAPPQIDADTSEDKASTQRDVIPEQDAQPTDRPGEFATSDQPTGPLAHFITRSLHDAMDDSDSEHSNEEKDAVDGKSKDTSDSDEPNIACAQPINDISPAQNPVPNIQFAVPRSRSHVGSTQLANAPPSPVIQGALPAVDFRLGAEQSSNTPPSPSTPNHLVNAKLAVAEFSDTETQDNTLPPAASSTPPTERTALFRHRAYRTLPISLLNASREFPEASEKEIHPSVAEPSAENEGDNSLFDEDDTASTSPSLTAINAGAITLADDLQDDAEDGTSWTTASQPLTEGGPTMLKNYAGAKVKDSDIGVDTDVDTDNDEQSGLDKGFLRADFEIPLDVDVLNITSPRSPVSDDLPSITLLQAEESQAAHSPTSSTQSDRLVTDLVQPTDTDLRDILLALQNKQNSASSDWAPLPSPSSLGDLILSPRPHREGDQDHLTPATLLRSSDTLSSLLSDHRRHAGYNATQEDVYDRSTNEDDVDQSSSLQEDARGMPPADAEVSLDIPSTEDECLVDEGVNEHIEMERAEPPTDVDFPQTSAEPVCEDKPTSLVTELLGGMPTQPHNLLSPQEDTVDGRVQPEAHRCMPPCRTTPHQTSQLQPPPDDRSVQANPPRSGFHGSRPPGIQRRPQRDLRGHPASGFAGPRPGLHGPPPPHEAIHAPPPNTFAHPPLGNPYSAHPGFPVSPFVYQPPPPPFGHPHPYPPHPFPPNFGHPPFPMQNGQFQAQGLVYPPQGSAYPQGPMQPPSSVFYRPPEALYPQGPFQPLPYHVVPGPSVFHGHPPPAHFNGMHPDRAFEVVYPNFPPIDGVRNSHHDNDTYGPSTNDNVRLLAPASASYPTPQSMGSAEPVKLSSPYGSADCHVELTGAQAEEARVEEQIEEVVQVEGRQINEVKEVQEDEPYDESALSEGEQASHKDEVVSIAAPIPLPRIDDSKDVVDEQLSGAEDVPAAVDKSFQDMAVAGTTELAAGSSANVITDVGIENDIMETPISTSTPAASIPANDVAASTPSRKASSCVHLAARTARETVTYHEAEARAA